MKKTIIVRLVCAICIVLSLLLTFLPTWIKIDGVSRKDLRTMRLETLNDLDLVKDALLSSYNSYDISSYSSDSLEEDLDDCDLPSTKGAIKKRFRETEALVKELYNEDISLKELCKLSYEIPKYINDTENLLETDICLDLIDEASENIAAEDIENTVDSVIYLKPVFYFIIGLFILIILIAVASVVTELIGKLKFFKYIFCGLLLGLSLGLYIGVPVASEIVSDVALLPDYMDGMYLTVTIMPIIATLISLVPIIVDIVLSIINKTKKAKG